MKITCITGVILAGLSMALSSPLSAIFVGYDSELFELTRHGLRLYASCFLLVGFNLFGSAFFTALSNDLISAFIAFVREFIFKTSA